MPIKTGEPLPPERFSCRIYGVLREGGKVLLTRSRFGPREFVNFPGGGVELGEAPIEALKREYQEETGLAINPLRVLYCSESAHPSSVSPIQIVAVYWLVERAGGTLRQGGNGDDVLSLFWSDEKAVPTDEMFPADYEFCVKLGDLLR